MAVFENYGIPQGYAGTLYSGDVCLYYDGEYDGVASGAGLCEEDIDEWYENLEECIDSLERIDRECYFAWPYQNYDFARIVVDAIILDGTEEPGLNGWDYQRADHPVYLGEIVHNGEADEGF